jgi:hypothetical protein
VPKPRGNIGTLPLHLREQINEKLRDNQLTYEQIAQWLLGVPIEPDGPPVSTRYEDSKDPVNSCKVALQRWFDSAHYKAWVRDQSLRDDLKRRTENIETRFNALGEDGQDRFMMSVLMQGVERIVAGDADAKDLFMLSTAYSNLRGLKKGDAQAAQISQKLEKIANEAKAARDKGKPLAADERKAILDKVDSILLGKGGEK